MKREKYSDKELQEFKDLITDKLSKASVELKEYKDFLGNKNNGTEDTSHSVNPIEDSQLLMSKEEAHIHVARQEKFINNLKSALTRIENRTYGICKVTGKKISKERLYAVPHTTQSISAKKSI